MNRTGKITILLFFAFLLVGSAEAGQPQSKMIFPDTLQEVVLDRLSTFAYLNPEKLYAESGKSKDQFLSSILQYERLEIERPTLRRWLVRANGLDPSQVWSFFDADSVQWRIRELGGGEERLLPENRWHGLFKGDELLFTFQMLSMDKANGSGLKTVMVDERGWVLEYARNDTPATRWGNPLRYDVVINGTSLSDSLGSESVYGYHRIAGKDFYFESKDHYSRWHYGNQASRTQFYAVYDYYNVYQYCPVPPFRVESSGLFFWGHYGKEWKLCFVGNPNRRSYEPDRVTEANGIRVEEYPLHKGPSPLDAGKYEDTMLRDIYQALFTTLDANSPEIPVRTGFFPVSSGKKIDLTLRDDSGAIWQLMPDDMMSKPLNPDGREHRAPYALTRNGDVVYRFLMNDPTGWIESTLLNFLPPGREWVLDYSTSRWDPDQEKYLPAGGGTFVNGMDLAASRGYDGVFGYCYLDGVPFYLYNNDGKTGWRYGDVGIDAGWHRVVHQEKAGNAIWPSITVQSSGIVFQAEGEGNQWYLCRVVRDTSVSTDQIAWTCDPFIPTERKRGLMDRTFYRPEASVAHRDPKKKKRVKILERAASPSLFTSVEPERTLTFGDYCIEEFFVGEVAEVSKNPRYLWRSTGQAFKKEFIERDRSNPPMEPYTTHFTLQKQSLLESTSTERSLRFKSMLYPPYTGEAVLYNWVGSDNEVWYILGTHYSELDHGNQLIKCDLYKRMDELGEMLLFDRPDKATLGIRSVFTMEGEWVVELVGGIKESTASIGRRTILINNFDVCDQHGYEEAFGYANVDKQPFYFFKEKGFNWIRIGSEEWRMDWDEVIHLFGRELRDRNVISEYGTVSAMWNSLIFQVIRDDKLYLCLFSKTE